MDANEIVVHREQRDRMGVVLDLLHIGFLETQLDLVAELGLELYAQHHIGKLDVD
jgi:bacterioferritin (cytochrome b1)